MSLIDKILSKYRVSETKIKVFRNLYWAVLGKVVTLLGSLFVGILVARYLGPEQYGLMSYVISYVSLFQIFAMFGMTSIEIREMARDGADINSILGTVFRIKFVLAIITVFLVIGTALIFETDTFTILMISLYSLSIILNRFTVIRSYFTSIVWNEYIVKTEITRTLFGASIKIILLLLRAPLWAFIAATVFDIVILSLGYVYAYKTKIGSMSLWKYDWNLAKYLLKQSLPILFSGAAVVVYQQIDQVMIGNMIDKESVGYFSVAAKFTEIIIFIPTILCQTISPILVRLKDKSMEEYLKKSQIFINILVWSTFIISSLVALLSKWLIGFTFGSQYAEAVSVLQVLSFKAVAVALSVAAGNIIIIEKIQKYTMFRDVLGCVFCVCLNLLLIPSLGVIGAAIVAILSNIVAGYVSDLFIPTYRHIFKMQTKAIFCGWLDLLKIKTILQ